MFSGVDRWLRAHAEKDGRGYPDWAVRYAPIVRRFGRRTLRDRRILEIGANENGIARFARGKVVAVDINPAHVAAARQTQKVLPVVADIAALPFKDHSFGVCVCMDTFEHIEGPVRYRASDEIVRTLETNGQAVVGFPCGSGASKAEERVKRAYRRLTGGKIKWLEEHAGLGLPNPVRVYSHFREQLRGTHRVRRSGNATLFLWEWMWKVLMCNWPGRGNAVFQVLLRWLVPVLSRIHLGRCYRTMIWIEPRDQ